MTPQSLLGASSPEFPGRRLLPPRPRLMRRQLLCLDLHRLLIQLRRWPLWPEWLRWPPHRELDPHSTRQHGRPYALDCLRSVVQPTDQEEAAVGVRLHLHMLRIRTLAAKMTGVGLGDRPLTLYQTRVVEEEEEEADSG